MEDIINKCTVLRETINLNRELIYNILSKIQPQKVSDYEINRSLDTLITIDNNKKHYNHSVDDISVFLPSNLPLYSFTIFGIIPSFMAKQFIYIKPNTEMREKKIIERLYHVLDINSLFPNIRIMTTETSRFIQELVPISDVIIFTGYNKNRDKIVSLIKPDGLLIYNGSGHNPIVVSHDANLDKAASDACFARFFNSGQDCAGPDAILVHTDVYQDFLSRYISKVKKLELGSYQNTQIDVGPIYRKSELQKFLEILYPVNPDEIIYGGNIDIKSKIVEPTVITRDIKLGVNFKEIFGPITFIHPYDHDEQLSLYFHDKDGVYQRNKMYVSLYGTSSYLSGQDDNALSQKNGVGILLYNQSIHEYERGNQPYGGYSIGASGVIVKTNKGDIQTLSMPIYIPKIIALHVIRNLFPKKENKKSSISQKCLSIIGEKFHYKTQEIFKENLIFGFIFGSVAQKTARFSSHNASDLDTFICLKERNTIQEEQFKKWLVRIQWEYGLRPDFDYQTEIVSYDEQKNAMRYLADNPINLHFNNQETFDTIIWLSALAGKKIGIVGDKTALSSFTQHANIQLKELANIAINSIEASPLLNRKMLLINANHYKFHKTNALNALKSLYKQKKYSHIISQLIPLGGEKIGFTQDDLIPYYLKNRDRKHSM